MKNNKQIAACYYIFSILGSAKVSKHSKNIAASKLKSQIFRIFVQTKNWPTKYGIIHLGRRHVLGEEWCLHGPMFANGICGRPIGGERGFKVADFSNF